MKTFAQNSRYRCVTPEVSPLNISPSSSGLPRYLLRKPLAFLAMH